MQRFDIRELIRGTASQVPTGDSLQASRLQPSGAADRRHIVAALRQVDNPSALLEESCPTVEILGDVPGWLKCRMTPGGAVANGLSEGATNAVGIALKVAVEAVEVVEVAVAVAVAVAVHVAGAVVGAAKRLDTESAAVNDPDMSDCKWNRSRCQGL
jgi:hypothetical protein